MHSNTTIRRLNIRRAEQLARDNDQTDGKIGDDTISGETLAAKIAIENGWPLSQAKAFLESRLKPGQEGYGTQQLA